MSLRQRRYLTERKGTVVELNDLPPQLKQALHKIGYKRRDVRVIPAASADIRSYAGKGRYGLAVAINLRTGKTSDIQRGSWGGANPYEKRPLDWVDKPVKIPPNGAIAVGAGGYKGMFITLYVHPESLMPLLPGDTDVSERETAILRMATYKSFYKKELFQRNNVTKDEILALVKRGYMKMNKAGATSVTAKGKNAMSERDY